MRVKLSLMGDWCRPYPGMLSMHDWPCLEMPTPMMWKPGFALQQNKLTKTVFHKSQFMALDGHDCGHWIPHLWFPAVPPLPLSLRLPVIIAFSKRKVMFSSSTVKAEASQIACSQRDSMVPLPMLTCGTPTALPSTFPVFNSLHNVSVNLTMGDLVAGIMSIVLGLVCDGLGATKRLSKGLDGALKELVGAANVEHFCLKFAFGILTSGARIAATHEGDLKLEAFSAYAGGQASFGIKREGGMGFSAQGQFYDGTGSSSGEVSQTQGNGRRTDSRSSSVVHWDESLSITSTETHDRNGGRESQTRSVVSRGSVDPALDGSAAKSSARTIQVSDTFSSGAEPSSSSGGFQGTSTAQGDWGKPL